MATFRPWALRAASSRDGNDCAGLTPSPAAKLSPSTTILMAESAGAVCAWTGARHSTTIASSKLNDAAKRPYPVIRLMAVTVPPPIVRQLIVRLADVHLDMASDAGTVNILRGITLDIAAGEIAAVVGPSGAGKSSLMMVAGGLERATFGKVEVAGRDLGPLDDDARARLRRDHIGIVFQGFHLIPTMTALENVALPLEFAGRPDAFDTAQQALERVGLG